jgi:aminopeptidase N
MTLSDLAALGASARSCAPTSGIFALLCFFALPAARAQEVAPALPEPGASGGALAAEQACYDVERYELALRVDPAEKRIRGRLVLRARLVEPARWIALDLDHPLAIEAVAELGEGGADGAALAHERDGGRFRVDLGAERAAGSELALAVRYGGSPRVSPNPPWKGGFTWGQTPSGAPWIATSCQGEGADLWWPCKDHPSDKPLGMTLAITLPNGLLCASNGVLRSDAPAEEGWHTQTWSLELPFSNYGIALNIAPYEVVETTYESVTGEKMPVYFWCLPESRAKAEKILPEFVGHLRFYEELLGPYPFRAAKYGIAETPHLGMEHQTIIAYGNQFRRSPLKYDWLHHHELAHEWWGNLVTCRDWKDMWIHEGFGTYMQALYLEKTLGEEAYRQQMRSQSRHGNRRPIAPRVSRDSKQIYFGDDGGPSDNDIYYKGSWVLHTLRHLIGDEAFFRSLREFCYPSEEARRATDGSCVRLVDTEDYIALVERLAERELDWFFEVYLRQPALPELVVEREGERVKLRWKVPGDLPFPMPLPVRVGGELRRVEIGPEGASLEVPPGAELEIDPHAWVLRAR